MSRSSAARTSAARDNLAFADVYRPGTVAKVRAGIPDDVLEVIDGRAGSSWLELEYDHWLMDGVMEQLALRSARAACRDATHRTHFARSPAQPSLSPSISASRWIMSATREQ